MSVSSSLLNLSMMSEVVLSATQLRLCPLVTSYSSVSCDAPRKVKVPVWMACEWLDNTKFSCSRLASGNSVDLRAKSSAPLGLVRSERRWQNVSWKSAQFPWWFLFYMVKWNVLANLRQLTRIISTTLTLLQWCQCCSPQLTDPRLSLIYLDNKTFRIQKKYFSLFEHQ